MCKLTIIIAHFPASTYQSRYAASIMIDFSHKKTKIKIISSVWFSHSRSRSIFRKESIAYGIFTDMKRSLTEAGKQVAQKTKEVSDTVQLKTQISREKRR